METLRVGLSCLVLTVFAAESMVARGQEASAARQSIQDFSRTWSESAWEPKDNPQRVGYMRSWDDTAWESRMKALRVLAESGQSAVPALRSVLKDGSAPERMLAAQALGFIPCAEAHEDLAQAAEHDSDAAVRLYAIDSLSIRTGQEHRALFRRLEESEKNRDVKRHLAYALERKDLSIGDSTAKSLIRWTTEQLDKAHLGQSAPEFELDSISGERIRLSSYRGKKSVVLVFVYGDT